MHHNPLLLSSFRILSIIHWFIKIELTKPLAAETPLMIATVMSIYFYFVKNMTLLNIQRRFETFLWMFFSYEN